jgi:hypothetical protein
MYERKNKFVHRFGALFQDGKGRVPSAAVQRMHPVYGFGAMVSFVHKCALAFDFGYFSNQFKSWTQLVRPLWHCSCAGGVGWITVSDMIGHCCSIIKYIIRHGILYDLGFSMYGM